MAKKTKEEILKALEGIEGGADFVAGFNALTANADKSAKSAKDLQEQLDKLKESDKALTDNYNKLFDFIGLSADTKDIDAALKEIKEKQAADKDGKGGGQGDIELANLKSQLNELKRNIKAATEKNQALEKTAAEEKSRRHTLMKNLALQKALTDNKAIEPSITAKLMSDRVKINDDDSIIFTANDGSEVTVEEGVKSFLELHPQYLANHQLPGAGGGVGGAGGRKYDYENMSPAEYQKLRAEGKIV